MRPFLTYLAIAVSFLALDSLWLGVLAKEMYQERLGPVINLEFKLWAGAIFYLVYFGGVVYFAVMPALKDANWKTALINGSLLGGLCYATYDLTNLATIVGWPLHVVAVDILWGMFVTGVSACVAYLVVMRL